MKDMHPTDTASVIIPIFTAVTAILALRWLIRSSHSSRNKDVVDSIKKSSHDSIQTNLNKENQLRNVFSVQQKPPFHLGHANKNQSGNRPFGSSYYYAHNNPNSKGGYTDGLRTEDYRMNRPKLLARAGVPVNEDYCEREVDGGNSSFSSISCHQKDADEHQRKISTTSTPISRYLWDDDFLGNFVRIHIDSLPVSSCQMMAWKDASILKERVEVRLIGERKEGLFVGVTSQSEKKYHLHIPKMYGEAESVKAIVKKQKLVIKITKKKRLRLDSELYLFSRAWLVLSEFWEKYILGREANGMCTSVPWPQLHASSKSE